jgi:pyrimidine operon attenuation protein / uracil phosphoribosyltransferase
MKGGGVLNKKTQIMDEKSMDRSITRMAHEILERNRGLEDVVLVGILTRGVTLANRVAQKLQQIEGIRPETLPLDATPYRDDIVAGTHCPVAGLNVSGRTVVLVDDVLYTGRTVRAAMDAILLTGRAKMIQFATLIDRGHRELPIRPDFIGKNVPTGRDEEIIVQFREVDDEDGVFICDGIRGKQQ